MFGCTIGNMKLHRFYIHEMHNRFGPIALGHEVWIHDTTLLHQWLNVLRFRVGDQLVLFNDTEERLYTIATIQGTDSVKLELLTDIERCVATREVYLVWSLLKKDKNDWILQKATELGVHKFIPMIAQRSEKTELNIERAKRIIIEAAEQCGRADIPELREPISLHEALEEYKDLPLCIAEQHDDQNTIPTDTKKVGILIGPEGGWSDEEKIYFKELALPHVSLSRFTLRAETAAITAVSRLLS